MIYKIRKHSCTQRIQYIHLESQRPKCQIKQDKKQSICTRQLQSRANNPQNKNLKQLKLLNNNQNKCKSVNKAKSSDHGNNKT